MHDKSGLTEEVRRSTVTLAEAEDMVLRLRHAAYVKEPRTAPLCGNSIATDRGFIARDMPRARRPPALPHDRRLVDQGAVPALVPAGLLRAAAEGAGPPGAGRHPGEHPRAGVLPADDLRAAARARTWRRAKAIAAELVSRRDRWPASE